jgi:hypothetical protein
VSQSNIILGSILFGFIVYITVKGQLPIFVGILTGNTAAAASTNTVGFSNPLWA